MKNQPILTNFPSSVFATAKRRLQARIRSIREDMIYSSLSGYSLLFDWILDASFLRTIDPTKRQRSFGHIPVFWAWLAQIFEQNASCSRAFGLIQSWYQGCDLPVPRGDTGGYCAARVRLKISFLTRIHHRVLSALERACTQEDTWRGFALKAIDGSSVTLLDTPANQKDYPQHHNSKKGCGFPIMGMVGLADLSHGGWVAFKSCKWSEHDTLAAGELLKHIQSNDLLLGDRGFCSYELVCRAVGGCGASILLRLHQSRHRKLKQDWKRGEPVGKDKNQRIVTWEKPRQQPPGSALGKRQWESLPERITVRYIRVNYRDRSGKSSTMILVSNLLDDKTHPGRELSELYLRRWEIELKLRDVKTTLGMECFAVRSPEMAAKTLLMMMIAYNLMRAIMQRAAVEAGKPIRRMSFKAILDVVSSSHESFRRFARTPLAKRKYRREMITTCSTKTINHRPDRQEPRAIKRRPKSFQLLTSNRATFKEIPHREKYRKSA